MHALNLADRALHIATTTMEITRNWTNTCYSLEIVGPSCILQRIPFLDMTEEYIFHGTIQAVCWVQSYDGAIVIQSEDDHQSVNIRQNYKINKSSIYFEDMVRTIDDKVKINKKNNNPSSQSPTSVIPESSPIDIIRPVAVKPFAKADIPVVFR